MATSNARINVVLVAALCLVMVHQRVRAGVCDVVPTPVQLIAADGVFQLTDQTTLVAAAGAEREAQQLASCLRGPTGLALPIQSLSEKPVPSPLLKGRGAGVRGSRIGSKSDAEANCIVLALEPTLEPQLGAEGYQLSVTPDRVVIRASTDAGLFYGGVTLRQFCRWRCSATPTGGSAVASWTIPCVEIEDAPRFVLARSAARRGSALHAGGLRQKVHRSRCAAQVQHAATASDRRSGVATGNHALSAADRNRLRACESPMKGDRTRGDGTPYGPFFYTRKSKFVNSSNTPRRGM